MTQQACADFFALINTNVALQQEVGAALEDKEDMAAATAFAEVAAKHGYQFTAQEAAQKQQEIIAAADGELEEEALDNVAGGACRVMGSQGGGGGYVGGFSFGMSCGACR